MLPADVARCHGFTWVPGAHDYACILPECVSCARRLEAVRDYVSGAPVRWMEPPKVTPCPERLERKHA